MATTRTLQLAFAGGEVSPAMAARVDDAKNRNGLALARNMVVTPTGVARKRGGFRFCAEQRNSSKTSIIKTFNYNDTQSYVVEIGERAEYPGAGVVWPGYVRFYTNGALVTYTAPAAYVPNRTFLDSDVNTGTGQITFAVAHGFSTGLAIRFTADNPPNLALPQGLVVGTVYYAIVDSPTVIRVATTLADALAGVSRPILFATSGGSHRCNVHYTVADLVSYLGANFYCAADPTVNGSPQVTPGGDEAYWYPLPASLVYEVPSPYLASALPYVNVEESGVYMSFLHAGYAPRELRRVANDRWTFNATAFGSAVAPPSGVSVTVRRGRGVVIAGVTSPVTVFSTALPHYFVNDDEVFLRGMDDAPHFLPDGLYVVCNSTTTTFQLKSFDTGGLAVSFSATTPTSATVGPAAFADSTNRYCVSSLDGNEIESAPSAVVTATVNNLFVSGSYNIVTWSAVTGARRYRIYKENDGLYGLIGETDALTFRDDNIAPDMGITPPINNNDFSGSNHPAVGAHIEQRRAFAASTAYPRGVWMTRTGTETDLNFSLPLLADDRVFFEIAAQGAGTIKHLVPMAQLVILTNTGEYRLTPVNDDAITPLSIAIRPLSYVGSSHVPPLLMNNSLLFCAARGGHVYELLQRSDTGLFSPVDVASRAEHLFDGLTIVDSARGKAPYPIAWFVSSNGALLSLTYMPDESVLAWARHDTDGLIERITVVQEGNEDVLYAVVNRTINGATKRYLERLSEFAETSSANWFFVDCGGTYTGGPASVISGLGHLEGKTVAVLANGVVQTPQVVSGGQITLAVPVTGVSNTVHVGLSYAGLLQTLPLALQAEALGHGRNKNVSKVWARVLNSPGFAAGPALDALSTRPDTPAATGPVEVAVSPLWGSDGQVYLQQADPVPFNVAGLTLELAVGGG